MAYRLDVYRLADRDFVQNPPDVDGPDFDPWLRRCDDLRLFDAPLGSGGSISTYWSHAATELGLPLLARLYRDGLELSGSDLTTLRNEVDALVRHWLDTVDPSETMTYSIDGLRLQVPLLVDLLGRADDLPAGIRIAQRVSGYVCVG